MIAGLFNWSFDWLIDWLFAGLFSRLIDWLMVIEMFEFKTKSDEFFVLPITALVYGYFLRIMFRRKHLWRSSTRSTWTMKATLMRTTRKARMPFTVRKSCLPPRGKLTIPSVNDSISSWRWSLSASKRSPGIPKINRRNCGIYTRSRSTRSRASSSKIAASRMYSLSGSTWRVCRKRLPTIFSSCCCGRFSIRVWRWFSGSTPFVMPAATWPGPISSPSGKLFQLLLKIYPETLFVLSDFVPNIRVSVDWLIDWLLRRLIDWLIDWLVALSIDWLIDWLIDCSIDWLIDWFVAPPIDWLIDSLLRRLIDWLIDWLNDVWSRYFYLIKCRHFFAIL